MPAGDYQGTYAAEKVIVTVGGVILSGFTDGDFVTAKYVKTAIPRKQEQTAK